MTAENSKSTEARHRHQAVTMIARKLEQLFGSPAQRPEFQYSDSNSTNQIGNELIQSMGASHPAWKSPYFSGADKDRGNPRINPKSEKTYEELQHKLAASKQLQNAPSQMSAPKNRPAGL